MNKQNEKPSILLLSAGSLVGQNIIQALGERRRDFHLLATNSVIDEPSLQDFDEVKLVPTTTLDINSDYAKSIISWIDQHTPLLVIPCRDIDVAFLSRLAKHRPDLSKSLLCGSTKVADMMLDKWESFLISHQYELPFAASALLINEEEVDTFVKKYGFPLIAKPRSGFASNDVFLIYKPEQLKNLIGNTSMMIQKYLGQANDASEFLLSAESTGLPLFHTFEADKHSIQIILGEKGVVHSLFTTLHKMRNGISVAVQEDKSDDAKSLGERCASAFSKLGWVGPLNIQCQRTPEGTLEIYEYNARFTGATAARTLLGFDELGISLQKIAGITINDSSIEKATHIVRQPKSRTVPKLLRASLESSGYWKK